MSKCCTLKEYMSCVSNSLSPQVNLYVPTVTTGNANSAYEALTIGHACHPTKICTPLMVDVQHVRLAFCGTLKEFCYLVKWCLWKNLVSPHYYRLVFGRAPSYKMLLQCITWQLSMQFNVKGWLETTKLKVSLLVGLVLNVSIVRLSVTTSTF